MHPMRVSQVYVAFRGHCRVAAWAQNDVPTTGSLVEKDVSAPMRDGVVLRADVLRASSGEFQPD
jgi:predicted acyl esterase